MTEIDCEQRSPEWFMARCGWLGASMIADMMARTKSGWGSSRANLAAKIICERLTGRPAESYTSKEMQWGIDNEDAARLRYQEHSFNIVTPCSFIRHATIPMSGASPDGLIDDDGVLELKCPNTNTHINHLLTGKVPDRYHLQMHWQMACTGRQWADFASYDPRLPEEMQLFVKRAKRDEALIAELEREVQTFLAEIDETVARLRERYGQERVAA